MDAGEPAAGAAAAPPPPPPQQQLPLASPPRAPAAARGAAPGAASAGAAAAAGEYLDHITEVVQQLRMALVPMAQELQKVRAFREECGSAVAAAFAASFALQEVLAALRAGAAAGGGGGVSPGTLVAVLRIAKDVRIGVGAAHRLLGQFGRAAWCEALIRHAKGEDAREKFAAVVANLNRLEDALWVLIDPDHTRDHAARGRGSGEAVRSGGSGGGGGAPGSAAGGSAAGGSGGLASPGPGSGEADLARVSGTSSAAGARPPLSARSRGGNGAEAGPPDPPPPPPSPSPSSQTALPQAAGKHGGLVSLRKSGQHRVTSLLWLPEAPAPCPGNGAAAAAADAHRNTSSVDLAGSQLGEAGAGGAHGCAAWAAHRHIKVVNLGSSVATLISGVEGVTAMCGGLPGACLRARAAVAAGGCWPAPLPCCRPPALLPALLGASGPAPPLTRRDRPRHPDCPPPQATCGRATTAARCRCGLWSLQRPPRPRCAWATLPSRRSRSTRRRAWRGPAWRTAGSRWRGEGRLAWGGGHRGAPTHLEPP
jgi:hypothetical protein